ncbi:uncharacterized protein LOC117957211 [Etheostoma cragini]|uniref:uncharacterized protein LOC117957211 n=1 Tax=Etheostoma cragini TaxID=417921 RepID=UPI00155E35E2|nr:uncharacterized protein LOC117957211 [Etheostoma cragini]
MFSSVLVLVLVLVLAAPVLLTPSASHQLQVRGQRAPRDTRQDSIKVVISEGCVTQGESSDVTRGGKEIDLTPGSPLILTHKINLVPSGSGSGSCGCEADLAALRERLERLEREVSSLREKCGGPEGGCCTSKESKAFLIDHLQKGDHLLLPLCTPFTPRLQIPFISPAKEQKNVPGRWFTLGPVMPSSHWLQSAPVNPRRQTQRPLTHRPLLLQLPGQPLAAQSGPAKPTSQAHTPFTHFPRLLQLLGQALPEQSGPLNPSSHTHSPSIQRPLLLQFPEQAVSAQSSPVKPLWHTHLPSTHLPRSPQSLRQDLSEQSGPLNPSSHTHAPSIQRPLLLQLPGQAVSEQSAPVKPLWHTHLPLTHFPRLLQSSGQAFFFEQSLPVNPGWHTHSPLTQRPLLLQLPGQAVSEQSAPVKPLWHKHLPLTHFPWLLQSSGQAFLEQSGPENPGWHTHSPSIQRPLLLQLPGQAVSEQSAPVKPLSHTHFPSTHLPRSKQSFGQILSEQSGPLNPSSHTHSPSTQRPLLLQFPGQAVSEHSAPVKPLWHTHFPSTHLPWLLQPSGQPLREQSGPVKPGSHRHRPSTHRPLSLQFPGQLVRLQSGPLKPEKQTHLPSTQRPWSLHSLGHSSISGLMEQPAPEAEGTDALNKGDDTQRHVLLPLPLILSYGVLETPPAVPLPLISSYPVPETSPAVPLPLISSYPVPETSPAVERVPTTPHLVLPSPRDLSCKTSPAIPLLLISSYGVLETPPAIPLLLISSYPVPETSPAIPLPLISSYGVLETPPTVPLPLILSYRKESDPQIRVQVEGGLTSYTQTGLAAGQDYTASVTGEVGGKRGAETSAEFSTLIFGPTNLRVVKTTSTSAVVQWEPSQGEIDRYRLTVAPNDGSGKSQEMTVPAGQDSAHLQQLVAGRVYDITLVAEKGASQSKPATTQATPGKTLPRVAMAASTMQVPLAPGQNISDGDQELNPALEVFDQQSSREDGSESDGPNRHSTSSVTARTKPLFSRKMPVNGTKLKVAERPTLYRKPNGTLRFNTTRVVPGWRNVGQGSLRKSPVGQKKKEPMLPKKPKPGVPTSEGRTTALHERDPSVDALSTRRRHDENKALSAVSGTDSDTYRQSSSEEPIVGVDSERQPDVGVAGQENHTAPVSPGPTGTVQSQEKKCMNKVKVTHIRLPHQGRGSGCKGDGTELVRKTAGSDQGSSETDDLKPSSAETDLDYTPGPLHKLLKDTFDGLNIKTFSVHLSEPSNLSLDAETVRKQIISGLKPLPPSFSWSSSSSSSTLQSPSRSSAKPTSSSVPSSPSSLASPSLAPSSSTAPSSLTWSMASPSTLPSPPSSSSLSSSDKSGSVGSNEPDVDNSQSATDVKSPEDMKLTSSEKGGVHLFQRTPSKHGYVRRPGPNAGLFQNKTRLNLRLPHHLTPRLNLIPRRETETGPTSTNELSSSPSSSDLEDSSTVDVSASLRNTSGDKDGATKPSSSGVQQNQEKMPTERGRFPVRRFPGYLHRPNLGPLQNKTRPNSSQLPPPSRPLNPASETRRQHVSSTEATVTLSSVAKESHSAEGTAPKEGENEDRVVTSMSTKFNQTLRRSEAFSTHRPTTKAMGSKGTYFRRSQLSDGRSQNKTRTNLRPPQHPHRGPMRKPSPARKQTGGITVGSQISHLEKDSTLEIPDDQSGGQDALMPPQGVQIRRLGEQGQDTAVRPQTNKLEEGDGAPIQTTRSGEEETSTLDSKADSDTHKDGVNAGKHPGATSRGKPTLKQTSDSRHGDPRSVKLPKRQPPTPTRSMTAQNPTRIRHPHNGGNTRTEDKTRNIAKKLFESKTESIDSQLQMGSDGPSSIVTREPLDYVGVTNRTSDGFTLVWDSPEDKYKNFVVTSKDIGKDEGPKKDSKKDQEEEEQEVSRKEAKDHEEEQEDLRKEAKDHEEEQEDLRKEAKDQEEEKEDLRKEGGNEEEEVTQQPTKETHSENGSSEHENKVPESVSMPVPRIQSGSTAKPVAGTDNTFKKVISGSSRSFQFENLPPQTEYTVTLLGKGPGLLSRLHKLVISTGPEPPTDIAFSAVTENSLTVSWTKPKTPISGFKVTYTHTDHGEPVSVTVDSGDSTLGLSQLSPGSSYEVSIISILGLDESDPIKDSVMTLPDPPKDLRAVNVTDTKALLLWRPALAAVDKYAIVYGSGTDAELRITVSGNAAEQQLSGLDGSTTYTVTISSLLGSTESSGASTSFTTTGGSGRGGGGPSDLQANDVTPRTALLSWKPPLTPTVGYRLTYQTEGQGPKEVVVDASVTEYNLTRLQPGSKYVVQLQAGAGGRYTAPISTHFTTGTLKFPFPSDCSQELLNGIRTSGEVEIFPHGKLGTPMMVYCDMETDGGGWTVFQRRTDGSVDFFRGWKDYTKGFGSLSGEFWLGLENLYNLTAMTPMSLRVDLRDKGDAVFAKYSTFELIKRNYKLSVGGYSGTAGGRTRGSAGVWFQNARAKLRRSLTADDSQVNSPSAPYRGVTVATGSPSYSPPDQSQPFSFNTSTIDQLQLSLLTAPLSSPPASPGASQSAFFLDYDSQSAPGCVSSLEAFEDFGEAGGGPEGDVDSDSSHRRHYC